MTTVIIVLFVLALIFAVKVEVNLDNTIWKEHGTDRPIIVLSCSVEDGVVYRYTNDPFDRHMSVMELITKFKYEGE